MEMYFEAYHLYFILKSSYFGKMGRKIRSEMAKYLSSANPAVFHDSNCTLGVFICY
jgi:hypothetical protein